MIGAYAGKRRSLEATTHHAPFTFSTPPEEEVLTEGKTKALALESAEEPHERGEQLERKKGAKKGKGETREDPATTGKPCASTHKLPHASGRKLSTSASQQHSTKEQASTGTHCGKVCKSRPGTSKNGTSLRQSVLLAACISPL